MQPIVKPVKIRESVETDKKSIRNVHQNAFDQKHLGKSFLKVFYNIEKGLINNN